MKILSVIPLKKGLSRGDLSYFTSLEIEVGHIVAVSLRNKKTLALVTAAKELESSKTDVKSMGFNLKKVSEDKGPSIFTPEFLAATIEVSKYFAMPPQSALATLLPNIFIEEYDKVAKISQKHIPILQNEPANIRTEKLLFQYPFRDRVPVYKTLIRESFARKKSVFLVLPTEFDILKWHSELARGIEQFTFVFHGGLSTKKNLKTYENLIAAGDHPVLILATAPYLAIPRRDFGVIILEHESSAAYRTIKRPYIDLRVVAEIFAAKIGAKFILADELLRLETIAREDRDHLHPLHSLSFRLDFGGEVEILEREKRKLAGKFKILEDKCREAILEALEKKQNVFIFTLRKGLATETVCRDCGDTLSCTDCSAPLVLYIGAQTKKRVFVCNRCERDWGAERVCARCGSWNLTPLGIGSDTVYEEVRKIFPKAPLYKLDKESAKSANGAKKIAGDFAGEKGAILVGTEMAFYYLKEKVPLAIIASFETLWSIPNFRMGEKVLEIAMRIADITTKKIIIDTKNPRDSAIAAIRAGNLLSFAREELADRQKLGYPPYNRFIKISFLGDKEETKKNREFLREFFKDWSPEIFSGFVARLRGKYATNALIKIDPRRWSLPSLSLGSSIDENLYQKLVSLPPTFEITVDPEDLL